MVRRVGYEVMGDLEGIELRRYPELLLATVHGLDDNMAFSILFDYIRGSSETGERIDMTAPVVSHRGRPPSSGGPDHGDFFTFVMPEGYDEETLPGPVDRRIDIHVQPEKTFAVLAFRGRETGERLRERESRLVQVLRANSVETRGPPFLMRYSSPFRPGLLRTSEVGMEVSL